jgi:hypothetical protein
MARTERSVVAAQARAIADAWSAPGAPSSWWLTAATFAAIADEDVLLDLGSAIPPDRLPPLLLAAALKFLAPGTDLARHHPQPGGEQPPPDPGFGSELASFARHHRAELAELCASHRYQMNEVGRGADVLPVLGLATARDERPIALVDLGTGAGLGLHLDRYHYTYDLPDGSRRSVGDPAAAVRLECQVRAGAPPVPARVPVIAARVGVDAEPLDLADPHVRAWLAACVPPEAGAVTRFAAASALARAAPAPSVRGDLVDVLPAAVATLPADALLCLVDTYVHVFLPPADLRRFDALVTELGRERDLDWVSVDPLVPLGPDARATVQGLDVPAGWVRENRDGGVFGVVGRVSIRAGVRTTTLLGRAHPGAAWLEWLD